MKIVSEPLIMTKTEALEDHWSGCVEVHLHETSQKGDRRGHQHPLLISGQAFKACDVGGGTIIRDQSGDHRANHKTQDWKWTCRTQRFWQDPSPSSFNISNTVSVSLTYRDVSRCAQEKINYDREKCREEPVPGWQRGQQTVGQTCNTELFWFFIYLTILVLLVARNTYWYGCMEFDSLSLGWPQRSFVVLLPPDLTAWFWSMNKKGRKI